MKKIEIAFAPFNFTRNGQNFLVREAHSDSQELDKIAWGAAEAFLDDSFMNYITGIVEIPASMSSKAAFELYQFYNVVFKACMLSRGRVIVVETLPEESIRDKAENKNNIAAAAAWYGPKEDLRVLAALRAGVLTSLRNYGLRILKRIEEYGKITHTSFRRNLKQRALTEDDAWYLQCIFTAKRFEGRGLMSVLVREGFDYALRCSPRDSVPPVILESTSSRSRARYLHLGFEIIEPWCIIGMGKVDSRGCRPANKKEKGDSKSLEGVKFTCMINWDCKKALQMEKQEQQW